MKESDYIKYVLVGRNKDNMYCCTSILIHMTGNNYCRDTCDKYCICQRGYNKALKG